MLNMIVKILEVIRKSKDNKKKYLFALIGSASICSVLFFSNTLLFNQIPEVQNFDEVIPIRVIQHMDQSSTLDTDWNIKGLPDYFRRVHFNFSGYLIAAYAYVSVVKPSAISNDIELLTQLRQFSRLSMLGVIFLVFLCVRQLWGIGYGALAAVAVMLAPLLFQDAHYARPEAFGTLLFTTCFALALAFERNARWEASRILLILLICGFLSSIKITYISATLFCVPLMQRNYSPFVDRKLLHTRALSIVALAVTGLLALPLGFYIGAPYALAHPGTYWEGMEALRVQYSGPHPPYSLGLWTWFGQLGYIASYFGTTLGILALALHCIGYINREAKNVMMAYLVIVIATITFFANQHVFFERNFSHLVPVFLILTVGGIRVVVNSIRTHRIPATALEATRAGAALGLFTISQVPPIHISGELRHYFSVDNVAMMHVKLQTAIDTAVRGSGASKVIQVDYPHVFRSSLPNEHACVLYQAVTYGDYWSRKFIANLPATIVVADYIPSRFINVPTSTLQTYHSATIYLLYDDRFCNPDNL
jgi:hypothetical protein